MAGPHHGSTRRSRGQAPAGLGAAMRRWSRRLPALTNHSRVQLSPMGRPFARPRDASTPHTRSWVRAQSASWFWVLRWAGAGMMARSDSCATSSVSALSAPRQLSTAPRRQPGRDGGVVCWQWLCSKQLPAQRWAHMDRSWQRALRETRLARTWTSCCTSRLRRGLAACRCGRRRAELARAI